MSAKRLVGWRRRIPAVVLISFIAVGIVDGFHSAAAAAFLDAWEEMIPRGKSLGGIAYGNGRLLAAGGDAELIMASNSSSWQHGTIPSVHFINAMAFGNGKFLAVGSVTNQGGIAMTSSDGSAWVKISTGPSRLDCCAFGKGVFVAVGQGTLLSSQDGWQWTSRRPANALVIYGVDFLGDHFVAVGRAGLTTTSIDGINWSPATTDGGADLYAAAYGNGTTVMVGSHARIKTDSATTSADEWNWQSELRFWDIAYGNGRFVAVGSILGLGVVYTSTNGFQWEQPIFGESSELRRIAFADGEFIAVGGMGTVITSTNGLNWTLRRGGLPAPLVSIAAGETTLVAVGGFYNTVGTVLTSSGDLTWQIQTWGGNNYPTRVVPANDQFLAVGSGAIISRSLDGIRWSHQTSGLSSWLNDLVSGGGLYVAVGNGGAIERSVDGVVWSTQSIGPDKYLYGVAYGQDRFVAVGHPGVALVSQDGSVWTNSATGTTEWLHAVAYGAGVFVAVGDAGTILRSTSGQTWEIQRSPTMSALWGIRYMANRFIALGLSGIVLISSDGINWQLHNTGVTEALFDAVLANNRIWIAGELGTVLVSEHEVFPTLRSLGWQPSVGFEFMLPTDVGRPCRLQASADLNTWQDLGVFPFSETNRIYFDSTATNQTMRFYRVTAE